MDLLELIDVLEDTVEKGASIPLSGKSLMDKEELLDLIEEIRINLPEDLKQARWVKEERQHILHEAQNEADGIIADAKTKAEELVMEEEIVIQAQQKAEDIVNQAQDNAREIRESMMQYTDSLLAKVEEIIIDSQDVLNRSRTGAKESLSTINDALYLIDDNRREIQNPHSDH